MLFKKTKQKQKQRVHLLGFVTIVNQSQTLATS